MPLYLTHLSVTKVMAKRRPDCISDITTNTIKYCTMPIPSDLLPFELNLALKRFFANRGLDLDAVMEFTPFELDLENRRLQNLAGFVTEYERCGSREVMEVINGDFVFPPVFPSLSPEDDWYRFELWLQGEATRKPLADMLPDRLPFRKSEDLADDEIETELARLLRALRETHIGIALNDDLPIRLLYAYLQETLGETFEMSQGGWVLDGCSAYCPGCIQRPWCEIGQLGCWLEDEEAGKIYFTDELAPYVSASPQSLALLQKAQEEEDARLASIKNEAFDGFPEIEPLPDEDDLAEQN